MVRTRDDKVGVLSKLVVNTLIDIGGNHRSDRVTILVVGLPNLGDSIWSFILQELQLDNCDLLSDQVVVVRRFGLQGG